MCVYLTIYNDFSVPAVYTRTYLKGVVRYVRVYNVLYNTRARDEYTRATFYYFWTQAVSGYVVGARARVVETGALVLFGRLRNWYKIDVVALFDVSSEIGKSSRPLGIRDDGNASETTSLLR